MDTNYRLAVCTECGSEIKLDVAKPQSFCPACGNKINVIDAVNKFAALFPTRAVAESQILGSTPQEIAELAQNGEPLPPPIPLVPAEQTVADSLFNPADGSNAVAQPGLIQPLTIGSFDQDEATVLRDKYNKAKEFLDKKEYARAAETYNEILEQKDDDEYAAHWGLFMVDERNFNVEEKLLQCFSCFAFRQGTAELKKEILSNAHLEKALNYAPPEIRSQYLQAAQRHAESIVDLHSEGCNNLITIFQRRYVMLEGTFETTGLMAASSRIGFSAGVALKSMGNTKMRLQFSVNKLNMLHLDVLTTTDQPTPSKTLSHYRGIQMNPENGAFGWLEFRSFKGLETETIVGELDPYHKVPFVLLGLWADKFMIRSANKVYFCKASPLPEPDRALINTCYNMNCVPVVDITDPSNPQHKSSVYYYVKPIAELFETQQKSKWLRKSTGGCYVATAVYGSYDAPQVRVLRRYRDEKLQKTVFGRLFIRFYYRFSPFWARKIRPDSRVGRAVRHALDKIVDNI